jgi:hypothetical protein
MARADEFELDVRALPVAGRTRQKAPEVTTSDSPGTTPVAASSARQALQTATSEAALRARYPTHGGIRLA